MKDRMLDAIERVCGKPIILPATVVCLTVKSSEDSNTVVPMFYFEEEKMMMTWAAMRCSGDESFMQLEVGRLCQGGAPLVKPGTLVSIQFGTDENVKRAGTIDMKSIAEHAGEAVARALQERIDIVETVSTSLTGTYGMGGNAESESGKPLSRGRPGNGEPTVPRFLDGWISRQFSQLEHGHDFRVPLA